MAGRRILILVPHPDDEVVGCAAAILRARTEDAAVYGLFLTTGLPDAATAWPWRRGRHARRVARRRSEAEAAAAALGLVSVGFGAIPARGLKDRWREAAMAVREALARIGPTELWVPAYEGGHADHDIANALGAALGQGLALFEFAEYNAFGSQGFPDGGGTVLPLNRTEREAKRRLLALYRSERANLRGIGLEREAFRPLPRHDYGRPPHPGRLHYERFHWVPFRHPRIDFTPGAEVRQAIRDLREALARPIPLAASEGSGS